MALFLTVFCIPFAGADGSETIQDLYSPEFLSGGSSVVSEHTPYADVINPAASADNQLITLDLNYLALTGDTGQTGWGHAVNIGASFPAKFGVITGSGNFLTSPPFNEIYAGTQGGVHLSFAKDLFPEFHVGAGLNGYFGRGWGVGLDLGVIHMPGDLGFLQDFSWGASLRNFGYSSLPDTEDYPRMFSLQAGAGATLLEKEPFKIQADVDVLFPGFTNMRMSLGGDVLFRDMLKLAVTTRIDVAEMINGDFSGLIPSFGLGFTFGLDMQEEKDFLGLEKRGWGNSKITVNAAAAPLSNGLWAFGAGVNMPLGIQDRTPPAITVEYEGPEYISPNHDGIKDELAVPITITDARYVKEYNFIVENSAGETVKTIVNKEVREEDLEFKNIMARLTYVKTGIPVPEKIRWDGYSDNGVVVPDGEYRFRLEAVDDNGNRGSSEEYVVIVDNTPPALSIDMPSGTAHIFSPNNDGSKDTLPVPQSGSREDMWKGTIQTADGTVVKTYTWENSEPKKFEWDGTGDKGELLPDGVYVYNIMAADRAGNKTTGKVSNIIKNTQETPISVEIDASVFAPGMEDSRSSIVITPKVPVTSGIESWSLTIRNDAGRVMRVFSGQEKLVNSITYEGKDEKGNFLPEGRYRGTLQVVYVNGNKPTSETPVFTVDTTRPKADVTVEKPAVFSPDGDGLRDTLTFYQDTSKEGTWKGTIRNEAGETVKTFVWIEQADQVLIWDGYDGLGRNVPDGAYTYTLESVDKALNVGQSNPVGFRIDTIPTPVTLQAETDAFSPNGDGIKDEVDFIPRLEVTEGIRQYTFNILAEDGSVVWTTGGRAAVPEKFSWDGFNNNGERAEEGVYRGEIEVVYEKGDKSRAASRKVELDSVYPSLEVSCETRLFSPDGDGRKDNITIRQSSSKETLWTAEIVDREGTVVRQILWKGSLDDFVWDGTDEAGNHVKDGIYSYIVKTEDYAGNTASERIDGIEIDTRPTTVFATADAEGFTPNGDGKEEEIGFNLLVNETEGVDRWRLDIIDEAGTTVREFSETRIPQKVIWNGERSDGTTVDGVYTARFTVEYKKGNLPVSETSPFILDTTPPEADVRLTPVPFSPDNDGYDDELTIELTVDDFSGIKSWDFTIYDRGGQVFQEFKGEGEPASTLTWNGKGKEGDIVLSAEDYPYTFTVVDEFGLTRKKTGVIPIDVLVVREGNKLKIQIANITFAPNSPEFDTRDPAIVDKNIYVIKRIAQILEKYSSYKITIEGHAVNLSWADPVKRELEEKEELVELSRKRAETVKNELVTLGIDPGRISVVGMGGTKPLVPHGDLENRWKNRRVEFILEK